MPTDLNIYRCLNEKLTIISHQASNPKRQMRNPERATDIDVRISSMKDKFVLAQQFMVGIDFLLQLIRSVLLAY